MTKVILRDARIIDPNSPHNGKQADIVIENGTITRISSALRVDDAEEITSPDLHVAPGFMDLHAHICDPGMEHKETLASAAAAAKAGGFTAILAMPDTDPVIDNKAQVEYILRRSKDLPVNILPAGALSVGLEGKDMAELFDMYSAGARIFCDADKSISHAGLLVRAMMYANQFGGKIFTRCDDKTVSHGGQMNEGPMSTMLGLKGIPALAEELMVARNIALAEYAETPVHFMAISTAKSVELIREAKAKGLPVTAAVHAYNICWNDEMLSEFDTNYKVNPPLRSEADRVALLNAVADGTIDCITSGHKPEDVESKVVEFDLAAFGITGLETCYSLANMPGVLTQEQLVRALSVNPRRISGLSVPVIKEGEKAELTAFDPKASWIYSKTKSLSKNTPLLGKNVNGGVIATFC
ncbi:MAG: dihydroorotase [Bacteroidia bacterium]|nr:dihydroorotase [Bacteroidia bacterium]